MRPSMGHARHANPLTAARAPAGPCTLVIFGATGDLARRKLLPGALQPGPRGRAARALPAGRRLAQRKERRGLPRRECEKSIRRFSRRKPDEAVLEGPDATTCATCPATFDDDDGLQRAEQRARRSSTSRRGEPLNRVFYLSTAPEFFPVIVEQLGEAGLTQHEEAEVRVDHREAVRPRPRVGARAQPRGARGLRGAPDLPHRPLPRQGDGPEHDGVPLRQRHLRAAVEPQLHRPRADHRGRGHRHRRPRRLLRGGGRAARHGPEPHAAAARAASRWSRRSASTADAVRDEKVKVLQAIRAADAERCPEMARARPVRRRASSAASGARLPRGGRRRRRTRRTETYAALRLDVDNWRWAGVPFYLRTGKRLARKVTEIAVTFKPVPHLAFSQDGSLGVQPNQLVLHRPAQRGRLASPRGQDPGTRMIIRPVNMEFLYGTAFLSQSPEAYERLITRRDARRRDALHP